MVIDEMLTKHLNLDHTENPQLLLIMGVDSWIHQLLINIKFDKEKKSVQPSEGGFAILFSDQEITTGINPIASVTKPSKYNCYKSNIVPDQRIAVKWLKLSSRNFQSQVNEIHARLAVLNRFMELGRPHTQVMP